MKRLLPLLAAVFLWVTSSSLAVSPEAAAILAKARQRLGGEAALNGINSIHFFGSIEKSETGAKDAGKSSVEIIFQKPCQQRFMISSEKAIDITGLDNYFAWRRLEPAGARPQNFGLNAEATKRLRANTWENLNFFHDVEQHGGTIIDQGDVEQDGLKCRKLVFSYGDGIDFVRYFEKDTGRLVLTETAGTIREEGEIVVAGVRFPQKLVSTSPSPADGKMRTVTIVFDRIALNETFPASTFEQPLFSGPQ